jgi:hypothetical protein
MSRAPEINTAPSPGRKSLSKHIRELALVMLAATLPGCAQPDGKGYARAIVDRPLPVGRDSSLRECAFVNSEIARQESMAEAVPPQDLLPETIQAIRKATQTNITALKSRATQMSCPVSPDASVSDNTPSRP